MLGGTYKEVIEGLRSTPITVTGSFILNRVSEIASILTP
jgi:hypothetical protein